ncbi:hypothetical protein ACYJ1Y_06035 [Natrialbaceae archaeon A-gly3]
MSRRELLEVAAHYVVMLTLVFLVLGVVREVVGDLSFWIDVVIIGIVVFSYRPLVSRLGVAPAMWEDR